MIVFSSLRLLLAVMGKFHELGFEPSKLAVIFLLLSQEASAKTISLGLFSLLPCNYSPEPSTQHLLYNVTQWSPEDVKHLWESVFFTIQIGKLHLLRNNLSCCR